VQTIEIATYFASYDNSLQSRCISKSATAVENTDEGAWTFELINDDDSPQNAGESLQAQGLWPQGR
jgi:hypothetical protein